MRVTARKKRAERQKDKGKVKAEEGVMNMRLPRHLFVTDRWDDELNLRSYVCEKLPQHIELVLAEVKKADHNPQLTVQSIWSVERTKRMAGGKFDSESFDCKVANMVELLKARHKFIKHKWKSDDAFKPMYMCTSKCVHVYKSKCVHGNNTEYTSYNFHTFANLSVCKVCIVNVYTCISLSTCTNHTYRLIMYTWTLWQFSKMYKGVSNNVQKCPYNSKFGMFMDIVTILIHTDS